MSTRNETVRYTTQYYKRLVRDTFGPDGTIATEWARRRIQRVLRLLDDRSFKGFILDAGSGIGTFAAILSRRTQVVALDFSKNGVSVAKSVVRAHGDRKNCELILCDVQYLPIRDSSVQTIVAADLVEHLPDKQFEMFLDNCRRVLVDEGILAIYTPNATNFVNPGYALRRVWPFTDPTHIGLRSSRTLMKALSTRGFVLERRQCVDTVLDDPEVKRLRLRLIRWLTVVARFIPAIQFILGGRVCLRGRSTPKEVLK